MTRWIVKGYQNRLVTRIRRLYERREANSEWGSREHAMLRRARINAVQVEQGYKAISSVYRRSCSVERCSRASAPGSSGSSSGRSQASSA